MRYRFLGAEAKRAEATAVVVGHTLDDRAETVLMHMIRGAGLDGLAAMPSRAPWPFGEGPDIARPLLDVTGAETEKYCAEARIEARRDPTNDLPVATRNRVRNELMPVLKSFNPRAAEALVRLADVASRDIQFIQPEVEWAWKRVATVGSGSVSIPRAAFAALPAAVATRILRKAADASGCQPEAEHIEQILKALEKPKSRLSIPGGSVTIDRDHLVMASEQPDAAEREEEAPKPIPEAELPVPGKARADGWIIDAQIIEAKSAGKPKDEWTALIAANAVEGALVVRSRKPGDRMRPLGLRGSKKLQDILVDAKIRADERDSVPVIADEQGIIWVAGQCIDERVAVTPRTRRVLRLRAKPRAR